MQAEVLPSRASDAGPDCLTYDDPMDWRDWVNEARENLNHAMNRAHDDLGVQREKRTLFLRLAKEAIEMAEELVP